MPHQQNAFKILGQNKLDNNLVETVATQVVALTYQSQMTAWFMASTSQCAEQQFAHLVSQQNMMHENMHQIIAKVNALSFNQSNARHGRDATTTSKEMVNAAIAADNALADPKTLHPMEDSLEMTAGLPQLLNSLPQICPQEESGHMKSHCRDDAPLVLEQGDSPQASSIEHKRSTARLQLHLWT
jgi:hypothetical protein